MSSHADPNPAGWTDEEWAGMLRDAEAEVERLRDDLAKAKRVAANSAKANQQLREAREEVRRLLVAATRNVTDGNDTREDGYCAGLHHAMQVLDRAAVGEE